MAAAAAEQIASHHYHQPVFENLSLPLVLKVPEMPEDDLSRRQANRFIGSIALIETVSLQDQDPPKLGSLMEALHAAAEGDESARNLVEMNTRADVIERTIKVGHIMRVNLEVNEHGQVLQHGQTMASVQANTLRFAAADTEMRRRSEAETRNSFRIEQLHRQDLLSEYNFVVFSRAADDMSRQQMARAGFFVETMSCAVQVTSASGGGLQTETAFVAGVRSAGEARHDAVTLVSLAAELGVDYSNMSAAEILDAPLLIHKSLMPNGAVDLVQMYDKHADGTFFGEAKPPQDYLQFKEKCAERETMFAPKVRTIVNQLIAEHHQFWTPIMATNRLHKISEDQMVEQAIMDKTIDPRVFGGISAVHIIQARLAYESGNIVEAKAHQQVAKDYAVTSSCPSGANSTLSSETNNGKKEYKKMKCPFCGDNKQYGDPCSPNQHCTNCDARVVSSKVTNRGNGGQKKPAKKSRPKIMEAKSLEQKRSQKSVRSQAVSANPTFQKLHLLRPRSV